MASVEIRIPQLGEGLQEARIVRFLKQPGESVQRDEPIFEMETDKAVMEIESPAAGVLGAWDAQEDQVLPIGAVIGRIESDGAQTATLPSQISEQASLTQAYSADRSVAASPTYEPPLSRAATESLPTSETLRNQLVAPRTKAYAREKGISDDDLARLAAESKGRLLPEAIDRFLAARTDRKSVHTATVAPSDKDGTGYQDSALPQRQRTLVYRLQRATKEIIPATMEMGVDWSAVEAVRSQLKDAGGFQAEATQFLLFAWCVAQTARNFPQFRSALLNSDTLRVYNHLNLGIAVALPEDELLMARVDNADALAFSEFIKAAQEGIKKAREGQDQTTATMPLSLTNMASAGIRMGIPIIAAPAVATLFVGEVFDDAYPLAGGGIGFRRVANMVLSFDHRVANGIGAAKFLSEIRDRVEGLRDQFPPSS